MRGTSFSRRSELPELMDDRAIGGHELAEALRQLRIINTVLGAAWPTIEGVTRLWRQAGRPQQLSLLDVGAGSGDVTRALLRWATRRGVDLRITLVDIHPETCALATAFHRGDPRVRVLCADVFGLPPGRADIVTAALFLHHFSTPQLPTVLGAMTRAARLGVVVNDLHRHPLAWASIWAATRLLSHNRMIRSDAPLSVLRGFSRGDLEALRDTPELSALEYRWRPMFRWLLLLEKRRAR